jgi:3-deoxy-D-manno-octulosonic-acid transferase
LSRFLYNLIFPLFLLVALPGYLKRMRKRGNYQENFGSRLGKFEAKQAERLRQRDDWVWVRAVSVGEMLIAEKAIRQWRELRPELRLVISTTTSTGYALAKDLFADELANKVEVIYSPLDFIPIIRRVLVLVRPRAIVFVEGELWPNLVAEAARRDCALALVNARMSPRSQRRFLRFRALARGVFSRLDKACVQEEAQLEVFQKLGVAPQRLELTGSIKFDLAAQAANENRLREIEEVLERLGWPPKADDGNERMVLMGGCTFAGEERLLAEIYQRLRDRHPRLRLLLAPRHFERAPEVTAELEALGLRVARRSDCPSAAAMPPELAGADPDAFLLDTTGELRHCYGVADVVFIGKSLCATGGQNPLEPLAAGKALLMGPRMDNFRAVVDRLAREQAAVQVADARELEEHIGRLLADPAATRKLAKRAERVLRENDGASERAARALDRLVFGG